jgi:hypothetical protein
MMEWVYDMEQAWMHALQSGKKDNGAYVPNPLHKQ